LPGATEQARQFIWPGKGRAREPADFAQAVMDALPPGAVVLCGWGEGAVLEYRQAVDGVRTDIDVRIVFSRGRLAPTGSADVYATVYPLLGSHPDIPGFTTAEEVLPGRLWRMRRRP
jgi:hypothetical protein